MPKILVVEDELAELFAAALRICSNDTYDISVAIRGDEAVRAVQVERPDVIIMDLRLPGLDGIEAIRRIRQFDRSVPIFAVTAFTDQHTREAALDAGANLYQPKPVDFTILLAQVEQALAQQGYRGLE